MIHVVVEAIVVGAIVIGVRNVLAFPIAFVLQVFGVDNSVYKARAFVGALGTLALVAFALLVVAVAWKSGLLSVIGVTLVEIATNVGKTAWFFVSGAWQYLWV